jgi:hypothetical protein
VDLPTSMAAYAATQQPVAEAVDGDDHLLLPLFHPGHGMGFQSQLLSDKRFYEHLEPILSLLGLNDHNNEIGRRCSSN